VTDVHGSDRCFRKFINAGKFYGANVLILGGDITGKMIVPIVTQADGTSTCSFGKEQVIRSKDELDLTMKAVRDSGSYPFLTNAKEAEEISADPDLQVPLFKSLMREGIQGWMRLAEERLKGTGITCYISPGNDDYFEIDEILDSSSYVVNPERKVVDIGGGHEMITLGFTNHTPWDSPREVDEADLERMIEQMAREVKDPSTAIYNVHVPPIDTPIDKAPKLDGELRPVTAGGQSVMISAGSSAVRKKIEEHQPLLGVHGHIHESRGMVKLGRTLCANPGSDYGFGNLNGFLCEIEKDRVVSHTLTQG
jgi:Icc-related predicted phosphoesterase